MKNLFAFFITLMSVCDLQAQDVLKNYENDKYRFSFSYPGEFLLEKINDDEWVFSNADKSWYLMYKIMHLNGDSYDNYVKKVSTNIINAYFTQVSAEFGVPERNPYGKYQIDGFGFDLYISSYSPGGNGMEKLMRGVNVYLNFFRKTSQANFKPDGILIYTFGNATKVENNKMTKQCITTFEKTVVFKGVAGKKSVAITVARKKPVKTTQLGKKPVSPKLPLNSTKIIVSDKRIDKAVKGKLTDPRDRGETYHTVMIGSQNWMAENLNVSTFLNGDSIPQAQTMAEWEKAGNEKRPAWCYYKNDPSTYEDYGKLYNWYAVKDPRGLAPVGWHVPGDAEWAALIAYLGGELIAGGKMKETGTSHWGTPNTSATNNSGFSGFSGGSRHMEGEFIEAGKSGTWWSSTGFDAKAAVYIFLFYNNDNVFMTMGNKHFGMSVRCLKD